jgi:hypothetical protein
VSEIRATAYVDGESIPLGDDNRGGLKLVLDGGWAPYAAAVLTAPYTVERAIALDPHAVPRPRVRVEIARHWHGSLSLGDLSTAWAGLTLGDLTAEWLTYTLGDLTELWGWPWEAGWRAPDVVSADLGVRGRRIDYAGATLTVRATSDEIAVQGMAVDAPTSPRWPASWVRAVLDAVGFAGASLDTTALEVSGSVSAGSVLTLDASPWDLMETTLAALGFRLLCDESRTWRAVDVTAAPPATVHLPRVTGADDVADVDREFADVLVWVGTGTSSGGVALRDVKSWPNPLPVPPYKVHVEERDYGQVGAGLPMPTDAEMALRLAHLQARSRLLTLTAPADLTVRPGVALTTGAPSLPELSGVVARVEWDVPDDTMTVTTRSTVEG